MIAASSGALANLGHEDARSTIANVLKKHGLEPAPERSRKTTWKEFLCQHRDVIVATDFFTIGGLDSLRLDEIPRTVQLFDPIENRNG